ncbi:thioesterase domain-containing protein [Actinomadura sp. KC06]|uniref:thioesterase domain-containing protein n=1 Tax=Actinomadura sp. KC06 TaxID=2530369 RepID=UPI001404F72E|nr:thioesterase domain-containing protein [Actinomadura sp. KC06]
MSESDDFVGLGGDSLGLVHLAGRVQERLGASVPVRALAADPTFANLVRRVLEASKATASGPVLLRQGERTLPVCFVPALTGGPMAYLPIADQLDGWTCYGFAPPRPGPRRPRTVAEYAEHYRGELAAVADRPYVLAGWSMGAIVAHELAHRAERSPALLFCIDGHPAWQRATALSPAHLAAVLPQLRAWAWAARGHALERRSRPPGNQGEARAAVAGLLALLRYRARPLEVPTVILRANLSSRGRHRLQRRLAGLYPEGVDVLGMEGGHWGLLTEAGATRIAALLGAAVLEQRVQEKNR